MLHLQLEIFCCLWCTLLSLVLILLLLVTNLCGLT
uniref:Uncharacterized protein n=1 Tax=Rhizophora mucronata TaxID=61149 RepID=A0A2P2PPM3_RHIMU